MHSWKGHSPLSICRRTRQLRPLGVRTIPGDESPAAEMRIGERPGKHCSSILILLFRNSNVKQTNCISAILCTVFS